jgi:hypothetical protein
MFSLFDQPANLQTLQPDGGLKRKTAFSMLRMCGA